jgi:4-hydroxybenzoate polyprenyltransferase
LAHQSGLNVFIQPDHLPISKERVPVAGAAFIRSEAMHRQIGLFMALSRTPHGVIDMAAPALAALLCLGHFPSFSVTLVGLITVFSGYTAVYALNDLVDLRTDIQKVEIGGYNDGEDYLDGVLIRHPLAKGALSLKAGVLWAGAWSAIAVAGAYWLNPVCVYIFLGGCLLEGLYCKLWRITPLRAVVNGVVKTLGAAAAVYAVNPKPSLLFLALLMAWLFFWEIGGQNIPADWTDIEEDRHFKAQTIPVKLGLRRAGIISVTTLVAALFLNLAVFWASPLHLGPLFSIGIVALNTILLLHPAFKLATDLKRKNAMRLFNTASYYPLANLLVLLAALLVK